MEVRCLIVLNIGFQTMLKYQPITSGVQTLAPTTPTLGPPGVNPGVNPGLNPGVNPGLNPGGGDAMQGAGGVVGSSGGSAKDQ